MKLLTLIQGSPEWHEHRATHFNASEAGVMLGIFPGVKRSDLIKVRATGIEEEISAFAQKIFSDGHHFEALCRPLAEQVIGEDLYPCVGEYGKLSASFDGLTMMEDVAWEHKTLNAALRHALPDTARDGGTIPLHGEDVTLPPHYCAQMEQQMLVSGAGRTLFMASLWDGETLIDSRACWYHSNPELRARIIAGWGQFEQDIAAFTIEPEEVIVVGKAPDQLPGLHIEVTGMVTASNLGAFKSQAMTVLGGINRDLQTDEDFANAEKAVTWAKGVEDRIDAAKANALAQTESIDILFRTLDDVKEETRRIRLELDKMVNARKVSIRDDIVDTGIKAARAHYEQMADSLGEYAPRPDQDALAGIGASIKGKRSIASMRDAVNTAVADIKIAASQKAEAIRANITILNKNQQHQSLFADRVVLAQTKAPEDLRNLVATRVAEHQAREHDRLEQQREQIRREEAAKLERQHVAVEPEKAHAATPVPHVPAPLSPATTSAPAPIGRRIKLGDINVLISPLSITAEGLASLGFAPVGTERAAKLYSSDDLPAIYRALASVIQKAAFK